MTHVLTSLQAAQVGLATARNMTLIQQSLFGTAPKVSACCHAPVVAILDYDICSYCREATIYSS